MEYLKCPVCQNKLTKFDNCYKCEKNHNYDISSKGYANMLLANQRHSENPGDSKEMILSTVKSFNNFAGFSVVDVFNAS